MSGRYIINFGATGEVNWIELADKVARVVTGEEVLQTGFPRRLNKGNNREYILDRNNDWFLIGVGESSFRLAHRYNNEVTILTMTQKVVKEYGWRIIDADSNITYPHDRDTFVPPPLPSPTSIIMDSMFLEDKNLPRYKILVPDWTEIMLRSHFRKLEWKPNDDTVVFDSFKISEFSYVDYFILAEREDEVTAYELKLVCLDTKYDGQGGVHGMPGIAASSTIFPLAQFDYDLGEDGNVSVTVKGIAGVPEKSIKFRITKTSIPR